MELSYTQNLEDYHLSLAFAGRKSGTYIDVGAGHPLAELADLYARLRPRDTAVCGLVGRKNGEIDFHVVDRLHGFSTTVEHVARKAQQFGAGYRTVRTPVMTLAQLCAAHDLNEIDFLKIDVE